MRQSRRETTVLDCIFYWDLRSLRFKDLKPARDISVKFARSKEVPVVAGVWQRGISQEKGSPWKHHLEKWTMSRVQRWFRHYPKRYNARILVAKKQGRIIGVSGPIFRVRSGVGRIYAGIVVVREERGRGVGTALLSRTLLLLKKQGLRFAVIETLSGITASKYLYPKIGGRDAKSARALKRIMQMGA